MFSNLQNVSRRVLPSGLTILIETLPYVRSVALGYYLRSGSAVESEEHSGSSHFLEHLVFKGTATRSTSRHRQSHRHPWRRRRRLHRQGVHVVLLPRPRRADDDGALAADRHRHLTALHRRRPGGGARRHPRRDQDGRGHARRPRARDLRHRLLARSSARPPDPRYGRDREPPRPQADPRPLRRDISSVEHDLLRFRQRPPRRDHPVPGEDVSPTTPSRR